MSSSLTLTFLVVFGLVAHAADWPEFMGPTRDQVSVETGLIDTLPLQGPPLVFEKAVGKGYSAPSVRGRTIFGGLVPYGEVWRTGANAATTLKTSGALQIGGLNVPAGTYTLYSLPTADGWKLIVNKQTGQWGTVYDKAQDLGRVDMSAGSTAVPVETMVIDFEKTIGETTELHVKWANVDASVQITAVK